MARPKNIKHEINTPYFPKVTPTWRWPIKPKGVDDETDEQLRYAACKLAEWDPQITEWTNEGWATRHDSVFWRIRDMLIGRCLAWRTYNWENYNGEFERQKSREKQLKLLARTLRSAASMGPNVNVLMSPPVVSEALITAQLDVAAKLEVETMRPRWTDIIEWKRLPLRKGEKRSTIVAALLTSEMLLLRVGDKAFQQVNFPIIFTSWDSEVILPWTAIAQFASCALHYTEDCDPVSLQGNVKNIWPQISRCYSP